MLNLLEPFALADLSEAERAHLLIECVKLGLAERNRWYGDPDFVSVPIEKLLSKAHADELRALLDLAPPRGAGGEPAAAIKLSPDTTYVCVVDAAGNAFSATPRDSSLLLGPMVPGLGFAISNRGLQSSLDPDNPNSVEPGKRPRLTPNPAIVVGPDFVMPFGSPGGEVQTQAMLQVLINHLDLGMDLQAAVEARRWASYHVPATEDPHPSRPGLLRLEASAPEDLFVGLAERGHIVEGWPAMAALAGGVCAIRREADGRLTGAADPRRMSYGIGW
jgi:gamma-glutamyltranspeptidase/glutathione hydrolase